MSSAVTEREWQEAAAAIDACRVQLRDCEQTFRYTYFPDSGPDEDERFTEAKAALGYRLRQAHLRMLVLLERAELPLFRADYAAGFGAFADLETVGHSPYDPEDLYSDPLIHISETFEALSAMVRTSADQDTGGLALLERLLTQTPYMLADRAIVPTSEADIRKPIYDILKMVFPGARREIPVSHLFKTYRADLGVPSLKALVEVKYALTEAELRSELDGIYADIKGYAGDPQWTRFFALFYTATPVAAPERMLEEFRLSRVDMDWTPIIVHGVGSRPLREPKPDGPAPGAKPVRGRARRG